VTFQNAVHCSSLRRVGFVGLLSLLAPVALWANSSGFPTSAPTCGSGGVCVYYANGTATGGVSGLSMTGSSSATVGQIGVSMGSDLGSVSFTTGALLSGTLSGGGTFGAGTMTITTTGWNGSSGVLFTGTFGSSGSPLQWTALGKVGLYYEYELSGAINGTFNGLQSSGGTAHLFFLSKTPYSGGALTLANSVSLAATPEPGTLGLIATGLMGTGLLARRKSKQASQP